WRGSRSVPGSGSCGGSTTIVTRAPRETRASSGSPASGKRSASRTAAPTSATASPGGGGRRTSASSAAVTTTRRDPASRGTRVTAGAGRAAETSDESRGAAKSARRRGSSSASRYHHRNPGGVRPGEHVRGHGTADARTAGLRLRRGRGEVDGVRRNPQVGRPPVEEGVSDDTAVPFGDEMLELLVVPGLAPLLLCRLVARHGRGGEARRPCH